MKCLDNFWRRRRRRRKLWGERITSQKVRKFEEREREREQERREGEVLCWIVWK